MSFLRAIIAFVVLCFSTPIFAAECTTNLYFINGVGYADVSKLTFTMSRLQSLLKDDPSICVQPPLFNQGNGILADMSETFALKFSSESGVVASFANLWQEFELEAIRIAVTYFTGNTRSDTKTAKQLDDMTAIVQAAVVSGKKVILVAHSEGNLFAKEIAARVNAPFPVGTQVVIHFGVAVPTTMRTDVPYNSYLTSSSDGIIKLVSNSVPPTFISSNETDKESLNHSFLASYLNVNHQGSVGYMDDPALRDKQGVDIRTIFISMVKRVNACLTACVRIWFS